MTLSERASDLACATTRLRPASRVRARTMLSERSLWTPRLAMSTRPLRDPGAPAEMRGRRWKRGVETCGLPRLMETQNGDESSAVAVVRYAPNVAGSGVKLLDRVLFA